MKLMNSLEFCDKLVDLATNHKTLYVLGCFGAPMNVRNKARYKTNNSFNNGRSEMIDGASENTFGFDCVCTIKGILWGWDGDVNATYGGASYVANGVPDVGANTMYNRYCTNRSTDFSNIIKGEAVWMDGHIGVYIGDGKVVECTPKWDNKVQITSLANIGNREGNFRKWTGHGRLPWIEYITGTNPKPTPKTRELVDYKVVKGDVLSRIALKYNTTVDKIVADNIGKYKSITPNHIVTGWTLKV